MALRVAWTESAWQELESAADYIGRDSPRYAAALVEEAGLVLILCVAFQCAGGSFPKKYDDALRELFVKSYRLIYEVRNEGIIILAFLHGARRFPSDLT